MIRNKYIQSWIDEMQQLLKPEDTVLVDGSKEQMDLLYNIACAKKDLMKLNQETLPGCYLHRSDKGDVARVENRTFICCNNKEDAGFTNNWLDPEEALKKLYGIFSNSYVGRVMYIVPFSMGSLDSEFHKIGIEITDSIYVALSIVTMSRVSKQINKQLNHIGDNWTKCLHCSCSCDPDKRYICHFPEKNMIISVNSAYGGNALLGKKCLALRLGSYFGKKEGWLAEHMATFGVKVPYSSEIKYFCAALPSGCGKTDLAMLDPCESFKKKGYEVFCIGDDISWLRIGEDGRLWAINPENGVFGACAGINEKTNANAFNTGRKNTIFTNVVLNKDDQTVWWEGMNDNPPENGIDWLGDEWNSARNTKGAHPNSRFAAPLKNCPNLSKESNNPDGVPISAIILGVKRPRFTPLVFEARDWNHGVFIGSIMCSETTVAISGETGVLRHDPFGMLPFCGYNMGDYLQHWIDIGRNLGNKSPKIFGVNWFRTDDSNNLLWPGFSENVRVLDWIFKRCDELVDGKDSQIGILPYFNDFDTEGINLSEDNFEKLFEIDESLWKSERKEIKSFYNKFGEKLPIELSKILNN